MVSETPSEVVVEGTLRAFEPLVDAAVPTSLNHLISARITGLAEAYGVAIDWSVTSATPPTVNDARLITLLAPDLDRTAGIALDVLPDRYTTSEDFAFYSQKLPALYFGQGIAKGGLGAANVHQDNVTIHPDALENGVRLMVVLAKIASKKLQ